MGEQVAFAFAFAAMWACKTHDNGGIVTSDVAMSTCSFTYQLDVASTVDNF